MDKKQAEIVNGTVEKVEKRHPTEYVSSRGVRLRLTPVSTTVIWEAQSKIKDPDVPMWHDDDADRDKPNPLDPKYIEARNEKLIERAKMAEYIRYALGTELIEPLPAGVQHWTDTRWSEALQLGGIEVASEGLARYVDWLRNYVLGDPDKEALVEAITLAGSLVPEKEVETAEDSFRSDETRPRLEEVSSN